MNEHLGIAIAAPLDARGSIVIRGDDGSTLLAIRRDGTVEGSIENASEAGAVFIQYIRNELATEWEYGTRCPMRECTEPHPLESGDGPAQPEESLWRRSRERIIPAGEWQLVREGIQP